MFRREYLADCYTSLSVVQFYELIAVSGIIKELKKVLFGYHQGGCVHIGMECQSLMFIQTFVDEEVDMIFVIIDKSEG